MKNKAVLITGATSGIGMQTAITLASLGASVIISGRNKESGEAAVQEIKAKSGNDNVKLLISDLSTISGVEHLAEEIISGQTPLDILINNAGSAANSLKINEDGIEINFATNVIAQFLLSNLLFETISKSDNGRIITLMGGDLPDEIDLKNMQSEQGFKGLNAYSQSKMIMMSLMYEFAQRSKDSDVTVNICYPGQASTNMTRSVTAKMFPPLFRPLFPIFKFLIRKDDGTSAKAASISSVFLASSDDVRGVTAVYANKLSEVTPFPAAAVKLSNRQIIWNYVNDLIAPLRVNQNITQPNMENTK